MFILVDSMFRETTIYRALKVKIEQLLLEK